MPGANFAFGCVCGVLRPPRRCLSSTAHPRAWKDVCAVSQGEEEAGQTVTAPTGALRFTQHTPLTGFWHVFAITNSYFHVLVQDRSASSRPFGQHDDYTGRRLQQEAEPGGEGRSRDGTGRLMALSRRGNTAGTTWKSSVLLVLFFAIILVLLNKCN